MPGAPSVIHFRCLDTMGLRDVARVIGAGQAGVRLTSGGLAIYQRRSRRDPPPLPPGDPSLAVEAQDAPPETTPIAPPPVLVDVAVRRPTLWAAALLALGISLGAAIAHAVTRVALAATDGASAAAAITPEPLTVSWPRATRGDRGSPAAIVLEPTILTIPPSPGANLPSDSAHASTAPTRAPPSPGHGRHPRPHPPSADPGAERGPASEPSAPAAEESDEATMAHAREALEGALP